MHMSVSTTGKGWRCWRVHSHSGKSPAKLISALLGVSYEQAREIAGMPSAIPSDFMAAIKGHLEPPAAITEKRRTLKMPQEFRKLLPDTISAAPYVNYLRGRAYTNSQIANLYDRYGLLYARRGHMKGRIIFPVRYEGRLISYTGRAISDNAWLRYKSLTTDAEKAVEEGCEPALGPINDYLLFYDRLMKIDADTLFICEGPFDALKVNVIGRKWGICATAVFTSQPTTNQYELLHDLLPKFRRKAFLLDQGTTPTAIRASMALGGLNVGVSLLPKGIKDPGLLNRDGLLAIARSMKAQ